LLLACLPANAAPLHAHLHGPDPLAAALVPVPLPSGPGPPSSLRANGFWGDACALGLPGDTISHSLIFLFSPPHTFFWHFFNEIGVYDPGTLFLAVTQWEEGVWF
jgi:hypothetical protein